MYICTAHLTVYRKVEFRGSMHQDMYRALRFLLKTVSIGHFLINNRPLSDRMSDRMSDRTYYMV